MANHLPSADPDRTLPVPATDPSATVDASADSTNPRLPDPPAGAPDLPGYAITGEIAKGGMGRVYAGVDLTLDREVAIKTLLPGANAERFVTESKITAKLPHPNIPPVHALGTLADGTPFLVMKLIRGRTLAAELGDRPTAQHDLPRFVQVFEQIAQAVGFAHSRGVIHRDLKPLNVMVGEFGEVQVMDWGLARDGANPAREGGGVNPEAANADLTRAGAVMGTPGYMAPEQARGESVDPRADVFALGSVLAVILTGKPAFVGGTAAETIRKAANAELSDALARLDSCGADVDLIALAKRCLSANRDGRPTDGRAVADEVAAYRAGVEARAKKAEVERGQAETRAAETRKRQRVLVWAGGVIAGVLVAGVVGTSIGAVKAWKQTDYARGQEVEAKRQEGIAKGETAEKVMALGAEMEANTALWAGLDAMTANIVGDTLGTQKAVSDEQKRFLSTVLPLYQKLAGKKGGDETTRVRVARAASRVGAIEFRLGRNEEGAEAYRQARDDFAQLVADFPTVPEYRSALARSHINLGADLATLGRHQEAEEQYRKALALHDRLTIEFPTVHGYRADMANCYSNLGASLKDLGQGQAADEQFRKGLALREKLVADFPTVSDYRAGLATGYDNRGVLLTSLGDVKGAEAEHRKGVALQEKLVTDFPADPNYRGELAHSHNDLGVLLSDLGQGQAADEQYRKGLALLGKLASDFPAIPEYRAGLAKIHSNLGNRLAGVGDAKGAEGECRKAVPLWEKLAADFPTVPEYRVGVAVSHGNLGMRLAKLGDVKEAEEEHRKALAQWGKLAADFPAVPKYRANLAHTHNDLGALWADLAQGKGAEAEYRKGLALWEKLVADFPSVPEHRAGLATSHDNLGTLLAKLGDSNGAEKAHRKGLALLEELVTEFPALPKYRADLAHSHNGLGVRLAGLGDAKGAEREHHKGLGIQEKLVAEFPAVPIYQIDLCGSYCNLGLLVRDGGQPVESLEWFVKAIKILTPICEAEPRDVVPKQFLRNNHWARAETYDQMGKHDDAMKDWDRAFKLSPTEEYPLISARRAMSKLFAGRVDEAVAEVTEIQKTVALSATGCYDFACIFSVASTKTKDKKQEYADRAMELLKQAVKAGFRDTANLKRDTDIDPLRDRDDFKKLLTDLEKSAPPKKK